MIKIFKTFEICDDLWEEVVEGFNESFEGYDITIETLKNGYYISNQLGYAYHAIDFDDETGEIRGFNSYTPSFYKNGLNVFVSGTTFVRKKYRKDIFIFGDLLTALRKNAKELGFQIEIGVPNHNSREYAKKFLKTIYIADLDYYILPIRISRCLNKNKLSFLDSFTKGLSILHIYFQNTLSFFVNFKAKTAKYSLIDDDVFYEKRFRNKYYSKYQEGMFSAYYRLYKEDNALVAYIMDAREKQIITSRALSRTVKYIIKNDNPDAIMYVGTLRIAQFSLFKVPKKLIPKPLPLTYYVLDKKYKEKYKDMSDMNNWNFSLMNFDVR